MKDIRLTKWGWLKHTVPVFILVILTCIFFSDVLFENKIFVHRDLSRYFYPLREFSAREFIAHRTPLWNPYIHCGNPHLAELQTCVFYPLSAIYLLFSYPKAFNYFIMSHILLAGIFMYILMRGWKYSKYASFLSAIVFMFGGYIISVINLLASLASVVWLPLVILFYERSLRKDWIKNSIFTGIFLSVMFLGGEPAVLYATFFILLLIGRPLRQLLLAFLVFIGLSAFQLLPFFELIMHSSRNAMDFKEASMWSLPPYALLDLFVPYLSECDYIYKDYWTRQSWLLVYYTGIFSLICGFIALKFDITRRRRTMFYILALGLLVCFGRYTPLYYFLYRVIPSFNLSRYPIKFFFMPAFSLSVLAGMGLDYYSRNAQSNMYFRRFLKGVLFLAVVSSFLYLVINLNFSRIHNFLEDNILRISSGFVNKQNYIANLTYIGLFNIQRGLVFFMVLSLCMFLGSKKNMRLNVILPFMIFLSFWDVFTANRNVYQNMGIGEFLKPSESIVFLKNDKTLFRIFNSPTTLHQNTFVPEKDYFEGMSALKERVVSNSGVSFGIYDAYGYGSIYNKKQEEVINIIIKSKLPDQTNLLNLLNVKYVISPKNFNREGYELVKATKRINIYENKGVMPRAFLVEKAVIMKDENKILERLKSKDFEPAKEVILEEDFVFTTHHPPPTIHEKVDIITYRPDNVTLRVSINAPKFLILSDLYYPGWRVYVDGKRNRLYRADYILRAVYLGGPGRHIVKFVYRPFSFIIGTLITLAVIGGLCGVWIKRLL